LAVCLALALALLAGGLFRPPSAAAEGGPVTLLELSAKRLGGPTEPLSRFRGQVLLVVNTASRCGYTPQYAGLQRLYERYRDRGFSILGFPSNDFGQQEPGDDAAIGSFCRANYGVEFPMFSKVRVSGSDAHPVYRYLTSLPEPIGGPVQWNFQKYLVDRNGAVVGRFAPSTRPEDPTLVAEIEGLLAAPAAAKQPR
jgi:glutathione peroxidase